MQTAKPLVANQLAWCLEELWTVNRRVVRYIRQGRGLRATGRVRPSRVVVIAEFDESAIQMAVSDQLDITQQFVYQGAVEALDHRALLRILIANSEVGW